MNRIILIISTVVVLVSCFAFTAFGAGQEPWNYEDYIHNVDFADGYNDVLVEIPSWASWIMVRHRNSTGQTLWIDSVYGTLLQGTWDSSFTDYEGYFNPIDSMKPLEVSNVPNGSTIRVILAVRGSNFDFDGFPMTLYYLDSSFQTLSTVRFWQDKSSSGFYELDFGIEKPTGCKYVCIQCPVSSIRSVTTGGNYQIEFTRTQLIMKIDALYYQQQLTQSNNKLLLEVDKQLQENGQRLDDIINGEVDSQAPVGSDKVDDFVDTENQLLDQTQDGFDQAENFFNEAPGIIALYASAFLFMSNVLEIIATAGWIQNILTISIALGLIAFIINMTATAMRSSHGKGGKE